MKTIRCYEVGDEVYPIDDHDGWNREQRGFVVDASWIVLEGIPVQSLKVELPDGRWAFRHGSRVEPVAVRSADLAGIPEHPS